MPSRFAIATTYFRLGFFWKRRRLGCPKVCRAATLYICYISAQINFPGIRWVKVWIMLDQDIIRNMPTPVRVEWHAVLCQLGICQVLSFWKHAGYFAKRRVRLVVKASRTPAATWSLGAPSCLCWIVQSSQFFSLYRIQEYQGDQSIIKPSICSSFGLEYRLRDYNHLLLLVFKTLFPLEAYVSFLHL